MLDEKKVKEDYDKQMENWKKVCQQPLYQFLKHEPEGRRIMELLFDHCISIGKAAQAITEKFCLGIDPILPPETDDGETKTS